MIRIPRGLAVAAAIGAVFSSVRPALAQELPTCTTPDNPPDIRRVCQLASILQGCKIWMQDSRLLPYLPGHGMNLFRKVAEFPNPPSKLTGEQIAEANKKRGLWELRAQDCSNWVDAQMAKANMPKAPSLFEKFRDSAAGQFIEKAGNKIGEAAAKVKAVLMEKADHVIDWVKGNAKSWIKAALKKAVDFARGKGEDYLLQTVSKFIEEGVTKATDVLLPFSRQVQLGFEICTIPLIASAVSTACSTLNVVGVACIPGCPAIATGLMSWMKKKFEGWAAGKIFGLVKSALIGEVGDSLVAAINAKIDSW